MAAAEHRLLQGARPAACLLRCPPTLRTLPPLACSALAAATTLLKTVGLLMFVFASVGLHLFGGLITTDTSGALVPAELVEALAESDFGNPNPNPNPNPHPHQVTAAYAPGALQQFHVDMSKVRP